MATPEPPIPDAVFREGASWFARNRGTDPESHREDFEAWLRESALHRRAYARAAEIFAMGKLLEEGDRASAPPEHEDARRRHVPLLAGVAAIAAAGAALFLLLGPAAAPPESRRDAPGIAVHAEATLRTADGESRHFLLADGSRVDLSPATLLKVNLGPRERRLALLGGAARFTVFHEARPFVVDAAGGQVTARGTLFEIALSPGGEAATVRLIEGVVDIVPAARSRAAATRRLRAGQSLRYAANAAPSPSPLAPAPLPPPVREFDGISIAELVAEANRGAVRPIRIDPAIARRRISGRFRTDDTTLLADRLAGLLGLRAEMDASGAILLRPR